MFFRQTPDDDFARLLRTALASGMTVTIVRPDGSKAIIKPKRVKDGGGKLPSNRVKRYFDDEDGGDR